MYLHSDINELTKPECIWLAGIIEGEGSIRNDGRQLSVRVGMTDKDVIETIRIITGTGGLNKVERDDENNKTLYYWELCKARDVEYLLKRILPLLHERRTRQAKKVLKKAQEIIKDNNKGGRPPKISDEEVEKIREDNRLLKEIAEDYGVSISLISRIKNGKRRKKNIH